MMETAHPSSTRIIRTPDQQLRVFISSTLKELAEERRVARDAVRRLRLAPVMFELGARPHDARDLYRAYLDQSHIFVGIYAEQYGWIGPGMTISGLEEEYRLSADKPRLIYIRTPAPDRDSKLAELLGRIRDEDGISYKYFSSAEELGELVEVDLALLLTEMFEAARSPVVASIPGVRPLPLPNPPYDLIGRERELEDACAILSKSDVRLLTLSGPGGGGKTRLGLELAHRLADRFDHAAYVELASIHAPELVADAIARALGIQEAGGRMMEDVVISHVATSRTLLVLDNFEQILGAAPLVVRLIEECPELRIVATSRTPLNVRGEREMAVHPLYVPPAGVADPGEIAQYPAVRLFYERARAVRAGFDLSADNAEAVAEICRRLDGLPLAIELAAARSRLLSPRAILRRLEQRLPLLSGGPRDLPERQQTMRSAIAWSYDLLHETEATLFRRLAVFRGGFRIEAAEAICNPENDLGDDVLSLLEILTSRNLIHSRDDVDGEPRFQMLETIREFAYELLMRCDEGPATESSYAEYFARFCEEAEPHLRSGQRDEWIPRLEAEIDNIRAVLGLARNGEPVASSAVRLAGTLGWFWHLRGQLTEGRAWATSLAQLPQAQGRTRLRAKILFPAGGLAWSQGDYEAGARILEESASIFEEIGDLPGLTDARGLLAGCLASLGRYEEALASCRQTAELLRGSGDLWGLAFILFWLGSTRLAGTGDAEGARTDFEEILTLANVLRDPWLRAEALNHLGIVASIQGDVDDAREFLDQSLAFHEQTGDQWAIARGMAGYGELLLGTGDLQGARTRYTRSAQIWRDMLNRTGMVACLGGLAAIDALEGHFIRAARLHGAAPEPVRSIGFVFAPVPREATERALRPAREALGPEVWLEECTRGARMTVDEAIAFAVTIPDTAEPWDASVGGSA